MEDIILKALMLFVIFGCCLGKSLNDTKTLINKLLANHQKFARPVNDQDDTLNVTVNMYFKSIQEFDEVQERFSYVCGISLAWQDAGMVWDPSQYGGVDQVEISWKEVWTPELVLTNPAKEIKSLGQKWQVVIYYANGYAYWFPGTLLETNCPVNSKNFPFDTQICTTSLTAVGYDSKKIWVNAAGPAVDLSIYSENSAWSLLKTSMSSYDWGGVSQIDFTYHLKRKPAFVIINIILPISFLSLLNILVFVLVPESGERVSFCITVLLSIAVFMTIISDTLPKTSEPVPIISYKLMVDMVLSSLATVVTIFNLKIYNKLETETKPRWLLSIYNHLYCNRRCRDGQVCPRSTDTVVSIVNDGRISPIDKNIPTVNSERVSEAITTVSIINDDRLPQVHNMTSLIEVEETNTSKTKKHDNFMRSLSMVCTCERKITWKDISHMIDRICLILFSLATVISFAVFMLVVSTD